MPIPAIDARTSTVLANRRVSRPTGANSVAPTRMDEAKFRMNSVPIVGITE
jgi:hypothetical protein